MADVDIVLPDGAAATVPAADLSRALSAGATVGRPAPPQTSDQAFLNSGLGQGITGVLGAGRAVTGGLTDFALSEAANLYGGEGARKDTLRAFSLAKEANPFSDMAGETAGILLGGGGLVGAGESAGAAVASRVGEGLLGKVAAGGARGLAEGAYLGAAHSMTEDMLGDSQLNGEKLFATMGKEALLGGVVGGGIGAAGYGLSRMFGRGAAEAGAGATGEAVRTPKLTAPHDAPYRTPGRMPNSTLDELAGAEGAGSRVKQQMGDLQSTIDELQKTGMPSDEAAKLADDMLQAAQGRKVVDVAQAVGLPPVQAEGIAEGVMKVAGSKAGEMGGAVDDFAAQYAKIASGGDAAKEEILRRGYGQQAKTIAQTDDVIRSNAVKLSKSFTKALRSGEDVVNEEVFTFKPSMMGKLTEGVDRTVARDASARLFQDTSGLMMALEELPTKGGIGLSQFKKIATHHEELAAVFRNADATAGDHFIALNKLKQAIGRESGFGTPQHMLAPGQRDLQGLYETLRTGLEDQGVWGRAGEAQSRVNQSFAENFARRNDFAQRAGVAIDRDFKGVKVTEGDFKNVEGLLKTLSGDATDAELQGVRSTEKFIDGLRQRINVTREFADLSPQQAAKLTEASAALDEMQSTFAHARKEAVAANGVKAQQLLEREGRSIGGLVGLIGDVVTKPLTTMERLAEVKRATNGFEGAMKRALNAVLELKAPSSAAVESLAPRGKDVIGKEIGQIRDLAGNPEALSSRVHAWVGGLAKTAPKTASEVVATATRALMYLAKEAPIPMASRPIFGVGTKAPRYSEQQMAEWEAKRTAVMGAVDGTSGPEALLRDMSRGKLNRNAIQAIEFVSPRLFQDLQRSAQAQILKMQQDGKLDKMTMQQQASIATLLKVPPTEVWRPDFMAMLQRSRMSPQAAPAEMSAPTGQTSKRAIKFDTTAFSTEAQAIEGR